MSPRRTAGFTLLEAIVAMVLLSGAAMAIFGWINGNVIALNRIHDASARAEATANVLEHLRTVNPMLRPQGEEELGAYRIRWNARPVTGVVDRGTSIYQFGLYDTRVEVDRRNGEPPYEITVRQVGYRQVRTSGMAQ